MLQISGAAGELGISLGQGFNLGLSQCLGQQTKDGWWMDCHINDCHISRLLGLWLGDLEFSAMHFPKHPRMKAHKQGNKIRECWGGKHVTSGTRGQNSLLKKFCGVDDMAFQRSWPTIAHRARLSLMIEHFFSFVSAKTWAFTMRRSCLLQVSEMVG